MGRPGKKLDRLEGSSELLLESDYPNIARFEESIRCGIDPEISYNTAVPLIHRRRYAQFFTPPKVAKIMAEWAVVANTKTLLEPALGMGVLARAALARKDDLRITAFEKDTVILRAFLGTHPDLSRLEVFLDDFLTSELVLSFDAVLMNPPYLRHHDLAYDFDIFAQFSRVHNLEISKLSNAYLLFTIKAAMAMKPGGRAAFLIPTEWMNANFGTAMKSFLVRRGFLREIIYFSSCSEIFDEVLTTACVLLLERPEV